MPKHYPDLPELHLKRHTDWFTDELFDHADAERFVFPYSRFYADMERLEDDPLEAKGMGVFYTHTPWGVKYRHQDDDEYRQARKIYHQWHHDLKQATERELNEKGHCLLVDCHSFSHHQVFLPESELPDINIGTNELTTSPGLVTQVVGFWSERGYSVSVNQPYAYSVEPTRKPGFETIMVEINKRCYLTEDFKKTAGFLDLKAACSDMLELLNKNLIKEGG
jgi:N-formylglutamate amidohydrolase